MRFINLLLIVVLLAACQPQASPATPPSTPSPPPATPPAATRVHVEPASLELQVGQTAQVSVRVEGIHNLAGAEIYLVYDPATLDIQDDDDAQPGVQVTLGDLLVPDFVAINQVEQGTLSAAFLQLPPRQPITGTGQLMALSVVARAAGTSALSLQTVNLSDNAGNPIPARIEHGQVVVK